MHLATRFLILALVAVTYAQNSTPPVPVQVRSLTIISSSLPEADRQRIVHALQGGTYPRKSLGSACGSILEMLGTAMSAPKTRSYPLSKESQDGRSADFTVEVNPGTLYMLGEITFKNTKVFTHDQLRSQFPSESGEHFNATELGKGLENLKNLYGVKGYANFAAIPKLQFDEVRHIVGLVIDVDEGRPVRFGNLRLEGVEPVAGAGRSLLATWKDMQGKLSSPEALKTWLATQTSGWPHEAAAQVHTEYLAGSIPDVAIDVMLHFQ
jgi:hypothetical protein